MARHIATVTLATFALALSVACSKSDSGAAPPSSSGSATPSASTAVTASAQSAASGSAPATTATDTSATAAKDASDAGRTLADANKGNAGSASTPAASGSAAATECGTRPLPDCPLQAWMKSNANPPVMRSDLPALATALDQIAGFAPPGFPNWASIAKDGAAAARSGDLSAAKAACRTCHDQYKQKYKTEIRARKI